MSTAGIHDSMIIPNSQDEIASPNPITKRMSISLPNMRGQTQLKQIDKIKDEYELKERLGEGEFGTVHVAIKNGIGTRFAVKSINAAKLERQSEVNLQD